MDADQVVGMLRSLKLYSMALAVEEQRNDPSIQGMTGYEQLGMWLGREVAVRDERRLRRLLRDSDIKILALPERIRYDAKRGVNKPFIASLLSCEWLQRLQNLVITGAAGTGKTWLACALAVQAARKGYAIKYARMSDLCLKLELSRGTGELFECRTDLRKRRLLILDDFGMAPLSARGRQDLFEVIDDRMYAGSTIITSQLPLNTWHDFFGNKTIADAILDRLVHGSHRLELHGDSQRAIPD